MAGLSAERNAYGHRLQCLARALVRVALFVIALRKRLALVDGDAARDHPPLIGNGLRDPIAARALAMPAGTRAKPYKRERDRPRARPKKVGRWFSPARGGAYRLRASSAQSRKPD